MRIGTTAFVVGGPYVGTIGKITGHTADSYYIDRAFGPAYHVLAVVAKDDVMKAPHPLGWYQRVQNRHGYCEGCDTIEAEKAARR